MANVTRAGSDSLSSWWKIAAIVTMVFGFGVLILITVKAYQNAPPIPATVVDPTGAILFTSADVAAGQEVFLKHGLMNNGTIWGHGGYLGPDFSAQYLHNWALDVGRSGGAGTFRPALCRARAGGSGRDRRHRRGDAAGRTATTRRPAC